MKKFCLVKPSKRYLERIGDYVLVMKEPYGMKDNLINTEDYIKGGTHGGFSKEEMFVPLIVVEA